VPENIKENHMTIFGSNKRKEPKTLLETLTSALALNGFYDGEEGAASGTATDVDDNKSDDGGNAEPDYMKDLEFEDFDLPENVKANMIKYTPGLKEELKSEKEENSSKEDVDKDADGDSLEPDPEDNGKGEDEESKGNKGDSESKETDDKNSSFEGDEEELEFADDVIEGLKGEEIKKLSPDAQVSLAKFHEKYSEASNKLTEAESQLEKMLADPVIKARSEMVEQGRERYADYSFTSNERGQLIQQMVSKVGLSEDEAKEIVGLTENAIEKVVEDRTNARFNNRVIEESSRQQIERTTTEARKAFLDLGKFNKDLEFKETDPNAFWKKTKENGKTTWVLNETHPEVKKYSEKILPIMSSLAKSGIGYEQISNMVKEFGAESLYTMVAKKLNLPVAINTGDRDKKIALSERKKMLSAFIKGKSGNELSAKSTSSIAGRNGRNSRELKGIVRDGFDIIRLNNDPNYYNSAIMQKPGDIEHAKKIDRLADEGFSEELKRNKHDRR